MKSIITIVISIIGRDERPQLLRPCRIALELLRSQGHRPAMEATEEEELYQWTHQFEAMGIWGWGEVGVVSCYEGQPLVDKAISLCDVECER